MAKGHISDANPLDSFTRWVQSKTFQPQCKCEYGQIILGVSIRQKKNSLDIDFNKYKSLCLMMLWLKMVAELWELGG